MIQTEVDSIKSELIWSNYLQASGPNATEKYLVLKENFDNVCSVDTPIAALMALSYHLGHHHLSLSDPTFCHFSSSTSYCPEPRFSLGPLGACNGYHLLPGVRPNQVCRAPPNSLLMYQTASPSSETKWENIFFCTSK